MNTIPTIPIVNRASEYILRGFQSTFSHQGGPTITMDAAEAMLLQKLIHFGILNEQRIEGETTAPGLRDRNPTWVGWAKPWRKWLITMVIESPLRLFPFPMA